MGRFSSWQPIIPSYSEGLKYLGDAFSERNNRDLKERELAQKSRFENEQNANSRAGKAEQERRDKVREVQEQDDRRQKLTTNLNTLLGKGLGSQAQALAASSQFEDPNTHQMRGVSLTPEIGAAPTRGTVDSTGNQALASFLQGKARPGQQPDQAATDDTAGALDFMEDQIHEGGYQKAQGAYDREKANPTRYRAEFPGGASAVIDTQESRRAQAQQAQEDARRYRAAAAQEPNPQVREQFLRAAAQVEAGMTNTDKAGVNNVEQREDAQGFKVNRDERNQLTREEQLQKARISGAGAAGGMKARFEVFKTEQKRLQAASAYEPVVQNVLHKYRFEELQGQHQQLAELFDIDEIAGNAPAASTLLAGRYAKFSQGAGVLSDSDMNRFYYDIGGKFGLLDPQGNVDFHKAKAFLQSYFMGTTAPQLQAGIEQSLRTLEGTIDKRSKEIGHSIESRLRNLGADEDTIDSYLEAWTPTYNKAGAGQTRGDRGNQSLTNPGAPRAAPGAPPMGPGRGAPAPAGPPAAPHPDDAAMVQMARQRLKANPNDQKALQVLQANGVAP